MNTWVISPYATGAKSKKGEVYNKENVGKTFEDVWKYDLLHGTIAIGGYTNLSTAKSTEEMAKLILSNENWGWQYKNREKEASRWSNQYWSFYHQVKAGDIVIAKQGKQKIVGVGKIVRVNGCVAFYSEKLGLERSGNVSNKHPNFLNVEWIRDEMDFGEDVFKQDRFGDLNKMVNMKEYIPKINERIANLFGGKTVMKNRKSHKDKKPGQNAGLRFSALIDQITVLRQDPDHKERAHESLVEYFYEILGFNRFSQIKHRQGRIDIAVVQGDEVIVINEVKKSWILTKNNQDALKQAYDYANTTGAQHVVITNGDYYAIFDRGNGLSYNSNFCGEFTISSLKLEDEKLIDKFKNNILKNSGENVGSGEMGSDLNFRK